MIGGNEIDCLGCGMDDSDTVDFCGSCDILHNEIGPFLAKWLKRKNESMQRIVKNTFVSFIESLHQWL